jgi:integrase
MRFSAYGERRELKAGYEDEGWTREKAEEELAYVLEQVRRGDWKEPERNLALGRPDNPTFHEFATVWYDGIEPNLSKAGAADYLWQLQHHLLPFFKDHRLSEITVPEVDRYRRKKVAEERLRATSINKTISRLGQILDLAMEYHPEVVTANPARGRRRHVKAVKPERTFLEVDQVLVLLEAAGQLDEEAMSRGRNDHRHAMRRPIIAALALSGPRNSELGRAVHSDLDFERRLIRYDSKTPAGDRELPMVGSLHDELVAYVDGRDCGSSALLFPTATGGRRDKDNLRNRIVGPVVRRANEILGKQGKPELRKITPHSFRRTFMSLMLAVGENPRDVMAWGGHSDPNVTMRIYAQVMRRGPESKKMAEELVGGMWGNAGQIALKPMDRSERNAT